MPEDVRGSKSAVAGKTMTQDTLVLAQCPDQYARFLWPQAGLGLVLTPARAGASWVGVQILFCPPGSYSPY